jgi:DNA-binding XRE family transcriptional regulator
MGKINEQYVKIFREGFVDRILSGIGNLESEIENADSAEEAFNRIREAEYLCRYLETTPKNRKIPLLRAEQIYSPPYPVRAKKYQNLADALKDFRKQARLSQMDVSEIAEISARTVYRLEKGEEAKVSKRMIEKIFDVFDIHPPEKRDEIYRLPAK